MVSCSIWMSTLDKSVDVEYPQINLGICLSSTHPGVHSRSLLVKQIMCPAWMISQTFIRVYHAAEISWSIPKESKFKFSSLHIRQSFIFQGLCLSFNSCHRLNLYCSNYRQLICTPSAFLCKAYNIILLISDL